MDCRDGSYSVIPHALLVTLVAQRPFRICSATRWIIIMIITWQALQLQGALRAGGLYLGWVCAVTTTADNNSAQHSAAHAQRTRSAAVQLLTVAVRWGWGWGAGVPLPMPALCSTLQTAWHGTSGHARASNS